MSVVSSSSVKTMANALRPVCGPHPLMSAICNAQGPVTEVEMSTGDFWRMHGDHRWRMIICLRGMVWITQERDLEDYVLEAGEAFIVTQRGSVLLQAIDDARVEITSPARRTPYKGKYPIFA